ncbi:hypothetical protein ACO22_02350 [Paracoccidioides brasiliensis]|uniref:Uncharacterized protein n=1 Tax=Paracoccidioides brasiliensis TaxID=121759 RepID=A0A1D2JIY7_PARBR|nr:hypothetical protein ACO22_02350 [Paracoccidioides brasiliensis]
MTRKNAVNHGNELGEPAYYFSIGRVQTLGRDDRFNSKFRRAFMTGDSNRSSWGGYMTIPEYGV